MPSFDTSPEFAEVNGLTAVSTSGSLDTLLVAWFTADCWALTVPVRA